MGQELAAALRERARAAKACYDKALKKNPTLGGRLVVGLQLADDGQVCASRLVKDTLDDPEVVSCVQSLFVGQRFPAPEGGCVNVALPLVFAIGWQRRRRCPGPAPGPTQATPTPVRA